MLQGQFIFSVGNTEKSTFDWQLIVGIYTPCYIHDQQNKKWIQSEQLMVTFAAGYIAGVFCAIVSHPADSVVSVINKNPGKSAGESKYTFEFGQITRKSRKSWIW